ncbi:MAG: hypothetical protein K2O32_03290 [Acetatifactor sp.]|nr:hypothetical protein [Acetatifactor sp.]
MIFKRFAKHWTYARLKKRIEGKDAKIEEQAATIEEQAAEIARLRKQLENGNE